MTSRECNHVEGRLQQLGRRTLIFKNFQKVFYYIKLLLYVIHDFFHTKRHQTHHPGCLFYFFEYTT
ncbi:hypothetical protein CW304_23275 [Bacillus sp. UFRGS-B20]|nr:hypothetical protein CW304_23275 [Bacillus sp. UFRGS-B20]